MAQQPKVCAILLLSNESICPLESSMSVGLLVVVFLSVETGPTPEFYFFSANLPKLLCIPSDP